jgi:GTP-binding protein
MLEWVLGRERQAHVLLTKADKLNRQESLRVERLTRTALEARGVTVQLFSANAKMGIEEARERMDGWLVG